MDLVDSIWLVDFGPNFPSEPGHKRPALVVGPTDGFADVLSNVFVVPLTTSRRGLNFHVEIEPGADSGISEISYAQCEQLRSISKRRLVHPLGVVDIEARFKVRRVLRMLLNFT
jgi:mRNA interferase MazF